MTHDEIRKLLAEQSAALIKAMVDTNQPIEKRIDGVNARLDKVNGQLFDHAIKIGQGGERMNGFREDIARIDRRLYDRRKEDKEEKPEPTGERRKLTMWDLYVVLGAVAATVVVLKFFGRLVP